MGGDRIGVVQITQGDCAGGSSAVQIVLGDGPCCGTQSEGGCVVSARNGDGDHLIGRGGGGVGHAQGVGESDHLTSLQIIEILGAAVEGPGEGTCGGGVTDDGGGRDRHHGLQLGVGGEDARGDATLDHRQHRGGDGVGGVQISHQHGFAGSESGVGFGEAGGIITGCDHREGGNIVGAGDGEDDGSVAGAAAGVCHPQGVGKRQRLISRQVIERLRPAVKGPGQNGGGGR